MLTREAIVATARRQLEAHGFEAVALRAVARELQVTAPALYDHVDSKSDLLALIAAEGFAEMTESFGRVDAVDVMKRLRARAVAYVAYAVAHPELFRLMFQYRPAELAIGLDNELAAATRAFETNFADISEAIRKGKLPDRDVIDVSLMLWSAVHGVATVAMMVPDAEYETLAGSVMDAMLAGMRPG